MEERSNRIAFIDGLRGVAILMVLFFHAYVCWADRLPYKHRFSDVLLLKYGWLGVQVFFMISGFVILMSLKRSQNFFQFIYHRWLRLFPAMFLVSMLIFFTARPVFPERPLGIPAVRDLLPGLIFIDENTLSSFFHFSGQKLLEGTFWSLFVEVKFYVVFGILFFAVGTKMAIVGLISIFLAHILAGQGHWLSASMGWFIAGALYYIFFETGDRKWLWLAGFASLVSTIALYSFPVNQGAEGVFAGIIVSAFFWLAIANEHLQRLLCSRVLLFMGFVSYPLYLVHENMLVALIIKLERLAPSIPAWFLPIIPMGILIFLAWCVAVFFEVKFRNILRSFVEGKILTQRTQWR
jgi:peptidoglycan/LPS O-acetylase OafA/YrhL